MNNFLRGVLIFLLLVVAFFLLGLAFLALLLQLPPSVS